ncbi:MAG: hypothetical protein ACRDP3_28595 [Streptomyces sp.]|uniref:hypothetical protein n=1 Tax=Streptomyces sp. TaxID=1931 RepID=UPI003D6AE951
MTRDGAVEDQREQEDQPDTAAAAGAGDDAEDVGIPKQQSAEEVADSEDADTARK